MGEKKPRFPKRARWPEPKNIAKIIRRVLFVVEVIWRLVG